MYGFLFFIAGILRSNNLELKQHTCYLAIAA